MKSYSDAIQALLTLPWWARVVVCAIIFALAWLCVRYAIAFLKWAFKSLRRPFIPARKSSVFICAAGGLVLATFSVEVSDGLQWVEQFYINPAFITTDTSAHVTAIYEAEIAKYCDPAECEIVGRRVREIAAKVGCAPLSIYEVMYSECGGNIYCIRKDGIAASAIQFTSAGLVGSGVSLDRVKQACYNRETAFLMDLTEWYLVSRAKGRALGDATGIYCAVFAPGYIGAPDNQTLYSTADGAAYYLNSGLDGYFLSEKNGRQIVMRSDGAKKGRITVGDLRMHLEMKKALLLKREFVSL